MVLFEKSEKTWLLNFVGEILAKMLILDTFSEPVGVFFNPPTFVDPTIFFGTFLKIGVTKQFQWSIMYSKVI